MEAAIDPTTDARLELAECPRYEVSDDVLNGVAPRGWKPNERMLKFARTYVGSPATDSVAVMAFKAGIDTTTLRRWRRSLHFQSWLTEVALKAAGTCVPRVWKAMIEKAVKGDRACAKMVVERFDPFYIAPRVKATDEEQPWAAKPGEKAPDEMVKRVRSLEGRPEQVQELIDSEAVAVVGADTTGVDATVASGQLSDSGHDPKVGVGEKGSEAEGAGKQEAQAKVEAGTDVAADSGKDSVEGAGGEF